VRDNGGKRDCAMFWFTADWRGSLKVQAMTWAEQGMYRHLLDLAWEHGGIPSDLDDLRQILRLTEPEFAAAWKRIGPCWHPHPEDPGRLVNERQERERGIRREVQSKRAAAGKRGAEERWQTDGKPDGKRMANAWQTGWQNDGLSQSQSHPPGTPCTSVPPPAAAPGDGDQSLSESGGGRGDEAVAILRVMEDALYRSRSPAPLVDRLGAARRLASEGLTGDMAARLWAEARAKGKDPGGLFAHWLDAGWREQWAEIVGGRRRRAR